MKVGYSGRGGAILASSLVLVIAVGFLAYGQAVRNGSGISGVLIHAQFNSANGLKSGADVNLSGVTVGHIQSINLDPKTQMADVSFTVSDKIHLPVDTAVSIGAPTMTSDNALQIHPGKNAKTLSVGGVITDTQDQLSLEQQVSNYIFGGGQLGK